MWLCGGGCVVRSTPGSEGDEDTVVCALDMSPTQLRIAGYIVTSPPGASNRQPLPEVALIRNEQIHCRSMALSTQQKGQTPMGAKIITITSGKGGVGKTTTTANVGVALARIGKKVIVMDADIGLRNLDVVMGLENRIVYDLVDVIEGRCKLRQAMIKHKQFPKPVSHPSRPNPRQKRS